MEVAVIASKITHLKCMISISMMQLSPANQILSQGDPEEIQSRNSKLAAQEQQIEKRRQVPSLILLVSAHVLASC